MCDASVAMESRRAVLNEALTIATKFGRRVATPATGDVPCACLKTNDEVAFRQLPLAFRLRYSVEANATATFLEAGDNNADRAHRDQFRFDNPAKTIVSFADMPDAMLTVTYISGTRRRIVRPQEDLVVHAMPGVPPPVHSDHRQPELVGAAAAGLNGRRSLVHPHIFRSLPQGVRTGAGVLGALAVIAAVGHTIGW